jgi:uncharacterized protein
MSGSLHATLSLHELESLADREIALSGELDISKLGRLVSFLHSTVGGVSATLRFARRRDGWLGAELDYRASLEFVCQRCLEPFRHEVAEHVDLVLADSASLPSVVPEGFEPFELAGGRLRPAELVEDEVIVAVPLAPKHARVEDCGSLARNVAGLGDRSETADR